MFKDGPLLVYGTLKVTNKDGSQETKNRTTAICRYGASHNKPFCDGNHVNQCFKGQEKALQLSRWGALDIYRRKMLNIILL